MRGPLRNWLAEYLVQNGRGLRQASLVFAITLLIAGIGAYWLVGLRYNEVVEQKNAETDALRTQVSELQDQLRNLLEQLLRREQASTTARDPDGIYQFGSQVGTAQGARVDESRGTVSFETITGAMQFNTGTTFEYRDFILRAKNTHIETRGSISNQTGRSLSSSFLRDRGAGFVSIGARYNPAASIASRPDHRFPAPQFDLMLGWPQ